MDELEKQIIERIESMKEDIIKFEQQLIQIPSTIGGKGARRGEFKQVALFVEKKMKEIGLETINKKHNVVGTYGNAESPALILYGHTDTVQVGEGWTKDPFGGEMIDGKIYGRGSCDDKACVTAVFFAAKALIDAGVDLNGKLIALAVTDEELGGHRGSQFVLDKEFVKADVCLLGDGPGGYAAPHHAGYMEFSIDITGKKAHATSCPDLPPPYRNEASGINAIQKMAKIIAFLTELREEFIKTESQFQNFPDHPSRVTSVNLSTIRGGISSPYVPDRCILRCVINTIPEQDVGSVKKRIEDFIEQYKKEDPDLTIKYLFEGLWEPYISDENTRFAKTVKAAVNTVYNEDREFKMFLAGSDAHIFHLKGIDTIMMGCGSYANKVHAEDEFVHIDDIMATTKVFALTALNYLR